MESSKMVQSLIGLRTLSQNWFRHFVAFQWNESDLCWLWCWFMRWDNLLLVKYSDLHTLSNVSTWSRFTHFLVLWLDLAIYALCRILMKCRDLRIFPGTNYRFPGTKNFSTPLGRGFTMRALSSCEVEQGTSSSWRVQACAGREIIQGKQAGWRNWQGCYQP